MEKKMLNVAWLNGATPLGKGGGASSGGSSGGEGSGSGESSSIEYLDISNWETITYNPAIAGQLGRGTIIQYSSLSRIDIEGQKVILCTGSIMMGEDDNSIYKSINYIAIDFNAGLLYPYGKSTPKENLIGDGITQEQLDAFPRITKEEFYNLEA